MNVWAGWELLFPLEGARVAWDTRAHECVLPHEASGERMHANIYR